jgi:HSP20 family protein
VPSFQVGSCEFESRRPQINEEFDSPYPLILDKLLPVIIFRETNIGGKRMFKNLIVDFSDVEKLVKDLPNNLTSSIRSYFGDADVIEHDSNYVIITDVPGVKKDDLKITMEDGVLEISGTRVAPDKEHKDAKQWIRSQIQYGDFNRKVTLGNNVDESKIEAEVVDGVLTITLGKKEKKGVKIKVK